MDQLDLEHLVGTLGLRSRVRSLTEGREGMASFDMETLEQ